MKEIRSIFIQFLTRKELLLYFTLIIACISLFGWLTGNLGLASYSSKFIPIAPLNVAIIITLTVILLIELKSEKSRFSQIITVPLLLFVILFCLLIFLNFFFRFAGDIENVIVKDPQVFRNVLLGRMSPISSLLFIFICISIFGLRQSKTIIINYIGAGLAVLVVIISSVLLIGYLYQAPLLYGSKIIPVSLPSSVCFWLISFTLLRVFEANFWNYNRINKNEVTRLLLRSFLPIVVLVIILQGFLDTVLSFNDINPPLTGAIILLIVIIVTVLIIYRVSAVLGKQLLRAEKALKESEEKFRSIMENSADAIFITNQNGKYVYSNKAASDLLGYSSIEIESKTFADLSPKDKIEEYFEIFKQILTQGSKVLTEIELLKKDGTFLSTDLSAVLLPDGTVYGSCRDITQRKKAELALKESEKQLLRLNADKDIFISILGHDLKSPFSTLLGLSGALLEDINKLSIDEIGDHLFQINKVAENTYNLLENLLDWARAQSGKIPFHPRNFGLNIVCKSTLEILTPTAESKNIKIISAITDDIEVFADPDMLKTVLRNLVSNAIKFTHKEGTIIVSAIKTQAGVTVSVSDNGIGIKPNNLVKLFDISQVLSTVGTAEETGTGLGLLLCKEFVEKNGGKIWVESEPGKGSTFYFIIPEGNQERKF
jgi:PAS domain S-box-containing protein